MTEHSGTGEHAPPAAYRQDNDQRRDDPATLELVELALDPCQGRGIGADSTAGSSPRGAGTRLAGAFTMALARLRHRGVRIALAAGALAGSIGLALALVMSPSGPAARHASVPPSAPARPVPSPTTDGAVQLGAAVAGAASIRRTLPATVARPPAAVRPAPPVPVRHDGGTGGVGPGTEDGNPDSAAPEHDDGGDSAGMSTDSGDDSSSGDGGSDRGGDGGSDGSQ